MDTKNFKYSVVFTKQRELYAEFIKKHKDKIRYISGKLDDNYFDEIEINGCYLDNWRYFCGGAIISGPQSNSELSTLEILKDLAFITKLSNVFFIYAFTNDCDEFYDEHDAELYDEKYFEKKHKENIKYIESIGFKEISILYNDKTGHKSILFLVTNPNY